MHVVGLAFIAVGMALFIGAVLQGLIGFGMVILSFPVLVLVEPALLPQSILVAALPMVLFMVWRNWGAVAWAEVGWFTLGRPFGLLGALALLAAVSSDAIALAGGCSVLGAIGLSVWAPHAERTPATLSVAGFVSALLGTAVAIGGPPIGLLYQHEEGRRLRSTVSILMLMGAPLSLIILSLNGQVSATDLRTGLALMPFALAGNVAARPLIPHFDDRLRPLILGACAIAAFGAMAKVLLT